MFDLKASPKRFNTLKAVIQAHLGQGGGLARARGTRENGQLARAEGFDQLG